MTAVAEGLSHPFGRLWLAEKATRTTREGMTVVLDSRKEDAPGVSRVLHPHGDGDDSRLPAPVPAPTVRLLRKSHRHAQTGLWTDP